ncbi:hypothetical protein C0995_016057 [Termitomyces sp. Mi166|nr:hypothetical protein C0995_016057 [Termitomyces sp. Mi166\
MASYSHSPSSSYNSTTGSPTATSVSLIFSLTLPVASSPSYPPQTESMPTSITTVTQRPIITICTQRDQGDVPSSVRDLLLSTKRLQELLKKWSLGQATETQVSDAYVQIGNDFNTTVRAFAIHQIDLSDIHSIPGELRVPLEQCLGEDPSPEILESYMPEVRRVLYKLLRGLQARQDQWKAVGARVPYETR